MLSPKTKQQISSLWDMFWSGGMTNPLTSIEQITYLIFLKRLEKLDQQRLAAGKRSIYGPRFNCDLDHHFLDGNDIDKRLPEGANPDDYCVGHGTCRWRYLRDLSRTTDSETGRDITPYDHMNGYVFPWLRALHDTLKQHNSNGTSISSAPMEDAFFQFPKDKTAIFQKAIARVDELFAHVGESREDDIMGDIFEYLLSQLQISGKNGQFRTPRHIIRFLIELAPPEAGQRIIDPTAGTAGFLINSIDYLKKSFTSAEQLILEWDGTPHNHIHDKIPPTEWEKAMQGQLFVGYDNDRTMARIGWMNMILHGIENPHIQLRDSLGKALTREESGTYHRVYANPPYTGTIDRNDLYLTIDRFPKNPRKANEAITYKTELLFTWLILDLLVPGGKAAVIVPEGVLFGSTGAHKELRRQLLFNHNLEAVISLPPGIFNPYTGVKTSVLVFQKGGDITQKGRTPRTERVWFYDVSNDGYSSGAKREPDYTKNDLWDALYKWQQKMFDESTDYFQPEIYPARWRPVDENVIKIFPELKKYGGKDADITELFGFPPLTDPKEIEQQIIESQRPRIATLYEQRLEATEAKLAREGNGQRTLNKTYERDLNQLDQLFHTAIDSMLENKRQYSTNPTYGRECLRPILDKVGKESRQYIAERVERSKSNIGLFAQQQSPQAPDIDWQAAVHDIVHEFARLDGYPIMLRSLDVKKCDEPLAETKSWSAPVRVLKRRDDWISPDGKLHGSHDAQGNVRTEYFDDPALYDDPELNIIKEEFLDPDANCIEANGYNLAAGRYKPFKPTQVSYEPPAKLIRELQGLEGQIMTRLGNLLKIVEGKE